MLRWLFTVWLRKRHDSTILTRNGVLVFDSKDKTIGRMLHTLRNFEFEEITNTIQFLRSQGILNKSKEGVVLDVGANIGMISTAFLLEELFDESIGFEPDPNNFRLLQKNIQANGLQKRFSTYNVALSNANGSLPFELSEKNFGDHRIRYDGCKEKSFMGEGERQTIHVDALTFDDFLIAHKEINSKKIKLVWMDIQGHEAKFLEGATAFFASHPKVPLAMEFWPYGIKRSGISKDQFCDIVHPLFKSFYDSAESGTKPQNIKDIDSLWSHYEDEEDPYKWTQLILFN